MPSETMTATPDWTALQGKVLDGGYEIGECLLTNPASASFRARILGDRFTQAVVNVFTPEAAPLEQYALWQEALELRHPNISSPITVGRLDWNNSSCPYVVLHKADENLGGVIVERALTVAEARVLLRSVGAGLEHLHAKGFVHSALSPEQVLALGDSIRISSTSIRRINTPVDEGEAETAYRAPESLGENLTVAADAWCLGATLFEVLTQKKCAEDCLGLTKSLPAPFDWIVERCLEPDPHERPTLSEVFAILSGELKRPPPKPERPAALAMAVGAGTAAVASASAPPAASASAPPAASASAAPAPATPTASSAAPAETVRPAAAVFTVPEIPARSANHAPLNSRPLPRPPVESPRPKLTATPKPVYTGARPRAPLFNEEKPHESPRIKFLSYAFLAIVLAGGLLWLAKPKAERPRPTVNPAARTQTATPAPAAAVAASQSAASPAATPHTPIPAGHAEAWRVVVFTFGRRDDADKRAHTLAQKHPGFDPQVFSADAAGPYLIVLGSPTTREQANRLRLKARSSGFPRDSYIQNFDR